MAGGRDRRRDPGDLPQSEVRLLALSRLRTSRSTGCKIELRHGEISSPAIVTVGNGWVFEIHDEDYRVADPAAAEAGGMIGFWVLD